MENINTALPTSYLDAAGPIPYGMTNDYMFRCVLQKNNTALKGLICSLLSLSPEDVASVVVTNPIELGEAVSDKEFILDINVLLNDDTVLNLEMQMARQLDWKDRSLSYLCRSFDQLAPGETYGKVKPTIHIGFLNFSPDQDTEPEFYASYRLLNEKTYRPYSDKFILRVVNLKQIHLATEEDRANGIDYWARLFVATSWEDIKMIAKNNSFLSSATQTIYESNSDLVTRQKCRARADYERIERTCQDALAEVEQLTQELASVLAEKDSALAEKDSEIERLNRLLAESGKTQKE